MKAYVINPLALLGALNGYTRPLDRHDFDHGKVPGWAGNFIAGQGETRRFASLSGVPGAFAISVNTREYTSDVKYALGTLAIDKVGNLYRYSQVGAVALVAGALYQRAAPIPDHLANTPPAVAVGATQFTYTPGATAGAANLYSEGFLQIDTTPGNGYAYRISGHAAISASTAFTLYLDPDDPIVIALTTSSRVGLHHNPYKNVIVHPSPATASIAGFAVNVATATYYTWLQTRGPVPALISGTPAVNAPVIVGATVDGAVDVWTAAAQPTAITVGYMMQVGVDTKNNMIFATID